MRKVYLAVGLALGASAVSMMIDQKPALAWTYSKEAQAASVGTQSWASPQDLKSKKDVRSQTFAPDDDAEARRYGGTSKDRN